MADGQEGVILSTIHTAKGQEYDEVYIDSDIAENLAAAAKNGSPQYEEEINVAYVGFTRAVKRLHLPSAFQTLLTDRWKDLMRGYMDKPASKAVKSVRTSEKGIESNRKIRTVGSHVPEREAKSKRVQPRVSIGDMVQTPHGPGKIIEISGEECLIDLEKQQARLWERMSRLAPVS